MLGVDIYGATGHHMVMLHKHFSLHASGSWGVCPGSAACMYLFLVATTYIYLNSMTDINRIHDSVNLNYKIVFY